MNYWPDWPHIHGSPVYGDFGDEKLLFLWPEKDYLKSVRVDAAGLHLEHQGPDLAPAGGMPGGMLSLVIDSEQPAQGVVFASVPVEAGGPQLHGRLRAYDARTLTRIWTSRESIDRSYWFAKFVSPTIAMNALLLPTFSNKVLVYGELKLYVDPLPIGVGLIGNRRSATQEDIFVVGANGVVYTNFEVNNGKWHGWIPLIDYTEHFPDHFTIPPQASLAAVNRDDDQEDLFAVGRDGRLYTSFVAVDAATGEWGEWSGWITLGAPAEVTARSGSKGFQPGSPVAAVKRDDRQVDVFVAYDQLYTFLPAAPCVRQ